jgi:hypothetical protein
MGNVVNFPCKNPPIVVAPEDEEDPHTLALSTLKRWISVTLKLCGITWTEKVLLAELAWVRARRMEQQS